MIKKTHQMLINQLLKKEEKLSGKLLERRVGERLKFWARTHHRARHIKRVRYVR